MTGSRTAPLRVHVLIDSLNWGGAESLLADLALGAPAAGIELSVGYLQDFNGSPCAARLRACGIEPELIGVRKLLDVESVRRVRTHLARVRPDVVHTHLGAADVHGTVAARSLGLPVVSTIHLVGGPPDGALRDAVKERLMGFVRRHGSARVITVSDAARAAYLRTGWDRASRVMTVHNGLAAGRSPAAARAATRAALGLDADALVVSLVAVLRPGKGHAVAIEAARLLAERFPRMALLLIGDGPSRDEVREMAAPLGDTVALLGHRSDVPDLLAATDVLLLPSSMEAFPTTLLEAAAAGVPVVATAVGGIPEIVVDGETGLLVGLPPTADTVAAALALLLDDDVLRARLGRAARARFAEHFTAERWAQRLRDVYDAVLAEAA